MKLFLILATIFSLSHGAARHLHIPSKIVPRLSSAQFQSLARYSQEFLKKNLGRVICQKNESGFIRINVPIAQERRPDFPGVVKARLNMWAPQSGVAIEKESIHTHPSYFESLIISGGYSHGLYNVSKKTGAPYDLYRIFKDGDKKSFIYVGEERLAHTRDASVARGDVIVFEKDLIHQVLENKEDTLSLNAVYSQEEYGPKASYNVYVSRNGTLDDIKTSREFMSSKESLPYIEEMIAQLGSTKID
jgi:ASC-1-like (ASCH) protein